MDVVYEFTDDQIHQVHRLYQQAWWALDRSIDDTRRCVAGSQICIGLLDGQQDLVGFTRVLTDYTFKALIFDVIVSEEMRGQGLGDRLISLVKNHQKLQRVNHFELYCRTDMQEFYKRQGFENDLGDFVFMRHSNRRAS